MIKLNNLHHTFVNVTGSGTGALIAGRFLTIGKTSHCLCHDYVAWKVRQACREIWLNWFVFLFVLYEWHCQSQRFYVKQNHFFFSSSSLQASDVGRGDDDDGGSHPDISASEDEVKQCSWPGKQTNLGDISHTSESCHPKERFNFLKVQKKLHQQPSTFSKPNFASSKFRNLVDHNKKCGEFV